MSGKRHETATGSLLHVFCLCSFRVRIFIIFKTRVIHVSPFSLAKIKARRIANILKGSWIFWFATKKNFSIVLVAFPVQDFTVASRGLFTHIRRASFFISPVVFLLLVKVLDNSILFLSISRLKIYQSQTQLKHPNTTTIQE